MGSCKLLLPVLLSLLIAAAIGGEGSTQSRESAEYKCQLDRLSASKPTRRIEWEAGATELFEDSPEQFRCAGVVAMRNIMRPNSLALPSFLPSPQLVYIEQGRGLVGLSYPGCPRSHTSESEEGGKRRPDRHQRVHRVERGDVVILPAGSTYYAVNDGDEDLVALSVDDLNNRDNQLDRRFRAFYLAGGVPDDEGEKHDRRRFGSILRGFDEELLAEAFGVDREIIKRVQKPDTRGAIVALAKGTSWTGVPRLPSNEETEIDVQDPFCSARITQNIDDEKEAYVYSRSAGSLTIASRRTLPTLRWGGLSAEKLRLNPNAMLAPQFSMKGHTVVYATGGQARVQVADHRGRTLLDQTVRRGEMYVVPQTMVVALKAGSEGYEAVAVKTTALPATSPLAGKGSVFEGMPLHVIANSYQISLEDAHRLKRNREHEKWLLSARRTPAV